MNTETGHIYREPEEIDAARQRREPLVEVSQRVAAMVERGAMEMDKDTRRAAWRARWFGKTNA